MHGEGQVNLFALRAQAQCPQRARHVAHALSRRSPSLLPLLLLVGRKVRRDAGERASVQPAGQTHGGRAAIVGAVRVQTKGLCTTRVD